MSAKIKGPKKGVSVKAMADHVDCTTESLRQYVAKKITKPLADGSYDLARTRVDVIRHLRNASAGRRTADGDNLSVERAKLAKEQTKAMKLKNAVAAGQFCPVQAVVEVVERRDMMVREKCLGIPSIASVITSLINPTTNDVYEIIRREVYACLEELASPEFWNDGGLPLTAADDEAPPL